MFSRFKAALRLITVEPILFFFYAALDGYSVVAVSGLYWKICIQKYSHLPGIDCSNLKLNLTVETLVQKEAAYWQIYISSAYIIPVIIVGPILGAYGDLHGRKINILLGITGSTLFMFLHLLEFAYPQMPLYLIPIFGSICASTGFIGIVGPSCYAYVADRISNYDQLTIRFTFLQVVTNVAVIIVGFLMGFVLRRLSFAAAALVPVALWSVSFFWTLAFLTQKPPEKSRLKRSQTVLPSEELAFADINIPVTPLPDVLKNVETSVSLQTLSTSIDESIGEPDKRQTKKKEEKMSLLTEVAKLVKGAIHTSFKPRKHHFRGYIWATVFCFLFLITIQIGLHSTLNLFCMHSPLFWTASDIAFYNGFSSIIMLIGNLSGSLVFKKLALHETTILLISMLSLVGKLVTIGLSTSKWLMYFGAIVGIFGNLGYPVSKSLACQFVDKDEVGKVYSIFQLATDCGIILSYTAFNSLYALTITIFPGFVFLLIAFLLLMGFFAILWVHIDYRRYRLAEKSPSDHQWPTKPVKF